MDHVNELIRDRCSRITEALDRLIADIEDEELNDQVVRDAVRPERARPFTFDERARAFARRRD